MLIIGRAIKGTIILNEKLRRKDIIQSSQRETLIKLLKKAQKTAFGKTYGFAEILKSSDPEKEFSLRVPTFDYNKIYDEWWNSAFEGKEDICWPGKVKYFALSSGTSGSPSKKIPITSDMIDAIRKAGFNHLSTVKDMPVDKNIYGKHILLLGGSTQLTKTYDSFSGDLSGIMTANLPIWLNFIYKPGAEISKERDWDSKIQRIVEEAPKWNVGIISGVPSWVKLLLERIIEHYGLNNIHEMWPALSVFSHGGVSMKPYKEGIDKLLGREIIYLETYLASEGFIAYEKDWGKGMNLILGNGIYYEFVPFDDEHFDADGNMKSSEGIVNYNDVESGKEYALLLSTCAGTWRYLIGDTVKFIGDEILITGRTKHFLSLCGEHMSVDNMNDAIQELAGSVKQTISEYCVVGAHYKKGFAHKWYLAMDNVERTTDECARFIDEAMSGLNDDYATERKSVLLKVKVIQVPLDLFYEWMEKEGKVGAQSKFPRVLKGNKLVSWENFLESRGIDTSI